MKSSTILSERSNTYDSTPYTGIDRKDVEYSSNIGNSHGQIRRQRKAAVTFSVHPSSYTCCGSDVNWFFFNLKSCWQFDHLSTKVCLSVSGCHGLCCPLPRRRGIRSDSMQWQCCNSLTQGENGLGVGSDSSSSHTSSSVDTLLSETVPSWNSKAIDWHHFCRRRLMTTWSEGRKKSTCDVRDN